MENCRSERVDEIVGLCAAVEDAVTEADWNTAGELLGRRHRLLEFEFAVPPATPEDVARLRDLAADITVFDRKLASRAGSARADTAAELKSLRRGRKAAGAYARNSR